MTNLRKILLGAAGIAAAAFATTASAQVTANDSIDVKAKIITPLTITGGTALDFGTATTSTSATTIVMTTAGARTGSTATLLTTSGNTGSAGTYAIGAETGAAFTIAFTPTLAGGYTLTDITASGCGYASGTGTIASGSACTLTVGGTLNVPANSHGNVTGSLLTTVTYQ